MTDVFLGQLQLKSTSVLIVGMGGLGCPAASYLAGAGIGRLGLMDGDTVELSNLHRQILHTTKRVGMLKVESAQEALQAYVYLAGNVQQPINEEFSLNPLVEYESHPEHLTSATALEIFNSYDLILDCTDMPASRYLISDAAVLAGRPLISASALRTDGQLLVLNYPPTPKLAERTVANRSGPCYRCVFPRPPPADSVLSCGEGGILGPVVGVMGVLMALEAIKLLTSQSNTGDLAGAEGAAHQAREHSMLIFSATSSPPFRSIRLKGKRQDCAGCSETATVSKEAFASGSLDYATFCGTQVPIRVLDDEHRDDAKTLDLLIQGDPRNRQDGDERQKSTYHLLDVRDETQFGLCSLPKSQNIPWTTLKGVKEPYRSNVAINGNSSLVMSTTESKVDPLFSLRNELIDDIPIYTICRYGNDSQLAVQKLKELGFDRDGQRRIADIKDGFRAWKQGVDLAWPDY